MSTFIITSKSKEEHIVDLKLKNFHFKQAPVEPLRGWPFIKS